MCMRSPTLTTVSPTRIWSFTLTFLMTSRLPLRIEGPSSPVAWSSGSSMTCGDVFIWFCFLVFRDGLSDLACRFDKLDGMRTRQTAQMGAADGGVARADHAHGMIHSGG